jgi:hypothetical protein
MNWTYIITQSYPTQMGKLENCCCVGNVKKLCRGNYLAHRHTHVQV